MCVINSIGIPTLFSNFSFRAVIHSNPPINISEKFNFYLFCFHAVHFADKIHSDTNISSVDMHKNSRLH